MKKDWFVIDPQQIQNKDYLSSFSHPTKSARLALFAEFNVNLDTSEVLLLIMTTFHAFLLITL